MRLLLCACLLLAPATAWSQSKRILYVTHSAGFRHDSIRVSIPVVQNLSPKLAVTPTEDLAMLTADNLRNYDGVLFFTSGELALSATQRTDLLEFVRRGGGFAGVHSATDTLYSWPEYGELIGGYFDGHPWVQTVRIDIEDPEHPAASHLAPSLTILEEIYQFRDFRRNRVRVLMSLDPASVSLSAPGVHQDTRDFPLAWVRTYGTGRVFYSALGHFDDTWRDPRFQRMLEGALLWITREADGAAEPRAVARPLLAAVGNAASGAPRNTVAPGSLVSLYGSNLTSGSSASGAYLARVLGTSVRLAGVALPVLYASPGQINARVPPDDFPETGTLEVSVPGAAESATMPVRIAPETAAVFAAVPARDSITLWATGLGVRPARLWAKIGDAEALVTFAGDAPGFPGLQQVNLRIPDAVARGTVVVQAGLEGQQAFYSEAVALPPGQ